MSDNAIVSLKQQIIQLSTEPTKTKQLLNQLLTPHKPTAYPILSLTVEDCLYCYARELDPEAELDISDFEANSFNIDELLTDLGIDLSDPEEPPETHITVANLRRAAQLNPSDLANIANSLSDDIYSAVDNYSG